VYREVISSPEQMTATQAPIAGMKRRSHIELASAEQLGQLWDAANGKSALSSIADIKLHLFR
jgi:hypothetical protein